MPKNVFSGGGGGGGGGSFLAHLSYQLRSQYFREIHYRDSEMWDLQVTIWQIFLPAKKYDPILHELCPNTPELF